MQAVSSNSLANMAKNNKGSVPGMPALSRTMSMRGTMEASRSALAAMISQIQDLDPYPCIFGIPVMVSDFSFMSSVSPNFIVLIIIL
jgi:hypothetical protein